VLGEGESASKVDQVVADSVNLDGRDGLAIAGLGLAEVFLDGSHGGFAIGEDRGEVVSKIVADGGLGLGGDHCRGWLVGCRGLTPAGWVRQGERRHGRFLRRRRKPQCDSKLQSWRESF